MKKVLLLLSLFVSACGATVAARPTMPHVARRDVVDMDEVHIHGHAGGDDLGAYDAETLFARGTEQLNARHCRDAVALYDRLATEFHGSPWVQPSRYNAGLCLSEIGENDAAAQHFRDLITDGPDGHDVRDAQLLLSNLLVRTEHWDEAVRVIDEGLARTDLGSDDREELLARRAQANFGANHRDQAEHDARAAIAFYNGHAESEPVRDDFYIAAANFVLAEIIRARANDVQLTEDAVEVQRDELERHARFLLDAQRAYFETIRLGNSHWAAASGYRVGQMYDEFWNVITNAPVPPRPDLSAELYRVFGDEYHRKLREMVEPLLRHAISYWEMTLLMVERTGVRNEWVDRTRGDLDRVRAELLAAVPGAAGIAPPSRPAPHPPTGGQPAATDQATEPGSGLSAPHPG